MSGDRSIVHPPHLQDAKVAFEELCDRFGRQEKVATLVGRAQSRVSDWGRSNTPDFPPIDAIDALEARTEGLPGWPQMTRWLCRRRGGEFLPLPRLDTVGCWGRMTATLAKEAGDLTGGLCADLADDMDVSPGEARRRLKDADDLVRIAVELRAALKTRAGEDSC
jgi:hypothetical protein